MSKRDFYLASIIGFLFGLLALLPAKNLGFNITPVFILISAVGFAFFSPLALFITYLFGRFFRPAYQFGKFAAVGALNTLIDLGVLNFLIILTDITGGIYFSVFKGISFLTAVTNSYFWNKFWTFGSRLPANIKEYARFGFFTAIGLLINVSTASFMVVVIGSFLNVNPKIWANVAALFATFVSLIWNFLAYKYIVFKSQAPMTNNQKQ